MIYVCYCACFLEASKNPCPFLNEVNDVIKEVKNDDTIECEKKSESDSKLALAIFNLQSIVYCCVFRRFCLWQVFPSANHEKKERTFLSYLQESQQAGRSGSVPQCNGIHLGREAHKSVVLQRLFGHVMSPWGEKCSQVSVT